MSLNLRYCEGFSNLYDNQGDIILETETVPEVIKRFVDNIKQRFSFGICVISYYFENGFFPEQFSLWVLCFPDAVGSQNNDLSNLSPSFRFCYIVPYTV